MIKSIILDFGGVVIDLDRNAAVKRFKEIGVGNVDMLLGQFHHDGLFQELEEGKITKEEFYAGLCKFAGRDISSNLIDSGWLAFVAGVPQHRLDYIMKLRDKYNVYLLSNTNPIVMGWAFTNDFSKAGKPLGDYFDKLYLSYKIKAAKPENAIYEYVIKDSGIDPKEALFLDDGAKNLEAAAKFGIHTLQTTNGEDWFDILENELNRLDKI